MVGLIDHLRQKGFDDKVLPDAGLAKVTHNGYMIDQFKDRLMFLAYDRAANGVGFVGRGRGQVAKYLNTATTPIYEKSKMLVGLGEQKKLACARRHSRQRSRPAVSDMSYGSAEATLAKGLNSPRLWSPSRPASLPPNHAALPPVRRTDPSRQPPPDHPRPSALTARDHWV